MRNRIIKSIKANISPIHHATVERFRKASNRHNTRHGLVIVQVLLAFLAALILISSFTFHVPQATEISHEDEHSQVQEPQRNSNDHFRISGYIQWVKYTFPIFIGEDFKIIMTPLALTHKTSIMVLLLWIVVLEIALKISERNDDNDDTNKSMAVNYCLTILMSILVVFGLKTSHSVAQWLQYMDLHILSFLWISIKLMVKVQLLKVLIKSACINSQQGQQSVEELGLVLRTKKCHAEYIIYETKQILLSPFLMWTVALLLHFLFAESNSSYSGLRDIHPPLTANNFLTQCLILLVEIDHIMAINTIMDLTWSSGLVLVIFALYIQYSEVHATLSKTYLGAEQYYSFGFGESNSENKLALVSVKLLIGLIAPWILRIFIGISFFAFWNTIGGAKSSGFWFVQIYLHLFCVIARMRVFAHILGHIVFYSDDYITFKGGNKQTLPKHGNEISCSSNGV